jgi:hypothetical protein
MNVPVPLQSIVGTMADCATMVEEILSPRALMASPGGPKKAILFFVLPKESGSLGFSEA